jgi:uncharacterized repeat protein (TIGR02543 family)
LGNKLSTSALTGGVAGTEGTFTWTAPDFVVNESGEYDVTFTPSDMSNYNTVMLQIPVTATAGGGGGSGSGSGGGGSGGGSGGGETTYAVTFDTGGAATIEKQIITKNGKAVKPADPNKEGFIFAGWYSDKGLTVEYDFNTLITSDITIYAKWTENAEGSVSTLAEQQLPFIDVNKTDWFYANVEYVYTNGLFAGTSAVTFSPNAPMTRAMLVTVLWRMEGTPAAGGNSFTDVANGLWYSDAVAWAAANEIVNGVGAGLFAPDADIMRQDMAVILQRYMSFIELDYAVNDEYRVFADEDEIAGYAKNAVQILNKLGIINGKGNDVIDPRGTAIRAEVAAILHRLGDLDEIIS